MAPKEVPCAHKASGDQIANKKRLVICCDGTWNDSNGGTGPPSNVSRLSGAVAHKCCSGMPQIVYYHPGAGTEASKIAHVVGGALGVGIAQDIAESYRFISDNYNPGDDIIIIGFSRGAFTARSVAGMVCALGFLNRSGLDQLPHIFNDYQSWQEWHTKSFDEKKHLAGITLENLKKLQRFKTARERSQPEPARADGRVSNGVATLPGQKSDEELANGLRARKEALYRLMASKKLPNGKPDLRAMADAYRAMLAEFELSLCKREIEPGTGRTLYVPMEGHVKAVGVWDTVGSLGIPKIPPFYNSSRDDDEIRFESLNVHPQIEYAFHAVALDEWRTAFNCTMWGKRDNSGTQLRQVWFPGTHCNVGGGWEDQQIATIALAWMADQLTSIGVEFSKTEMSRIFYDIRPQARARKWGLGLIRNPDGATSYPDWLYSYLAAPARKLMRVTTDYVTRTPGGYKEDDGKERLVAPNELIHPCVRIRYLYGGLNMDDNGPWTCRALTERGYRLERRQEPATKIRPARELKDKSLTYHSVRGPVESYHGTLPEVSSAGTDDHPFVKVEQPQEAKDLYELKPVRSHWVWVHEPKPAPRGKKSEDKLPDLPEEHIGMWERMFINVSEKLVEWQLVADQAAKDKGTFKEEKKGKGMLSSAGDALMSMFGAGPQPHVHQAVIEDSEYIPVAHGFHDFVSWQTGDPKPENWKPPKARA